MPVRYDQCDIAHTRAPRGRIVHLVQTAKTPAALKRLIQMRLDALAEDDDEQIFARDVHWHALDEDGRNWDMSGYRGPASYGTEVRLVVDRLRREYSLEEDRLHS